MSQSIANPGRPVSVMLVIGDGAEAAQQIAQYLTPIANRSFAGTHVPSVDEAEASFVRGGCDVVVLDLADSTASLAALMRQVERLRVAAPETPIVALTDLNGDLVGLAAIQKGAQDYVLKSRLPARLPQAILAAIERQRAGVNLNQVAARHPDALVVLQDTGELRLVNPAAHALYRGDLPTLFGDARPFDLKDGVIRHLQLPRAEGATALVEVRVSDTVWNEQPAFVVSGRDVTALVNRARQSGGAGKSADGVLDRAGLEHALAVEGERMRRQGISLAAILFFYDNLRRVQQGMGAEAAAQAAAVVVDSLREFARPSDHVGRVTDDAFLVLLPETRLAEAAVAAERVRAKVEERSVPVSDGSINGRMKIQLSFGVAAVSGSKTSLKELFNLCKESLRATRPELKSLVWNKSPLPARAGDAQMPSISLNTRAVVDDLRAIPTRIVKLTDETVTGCEFLIRGPPGPLESPDALFAAGSGDVKSIAELDLRCLRTCVEAMKAMPADIRCHFNIFPATILNVPPDTLIKILRGAAHRGPLCLEISEQRFVGDPSALVPHLRAIRQAGIEVAIDDVGFGRGSLESLLVIEPQVVKIDRGYVDGIAADEERKRLLRRFVSIIKSIGATAIAEGIERREDLFILRQIGIEFGQGWLWGKPQPVAPPPG